MIRNKHAFFCLIFFLCAVLSFGEDRPDALALFMEKKYAESEQACLAEINENQKNMESFIVLGWTLLAQKKYKDASYYTEEAMKISRYDLRNLFTAAEAFYYVGNNAKALKYLEEYAQLAPTSKKIKYIYYLMGEVFIRLSEYSSADIAFSTALHYDNNVADWWARLGYAREMRKDYQYALDAYENALKLEPDNTEAKRGKSKIKQILG